MKKIQNIGPKSAFMSLAFETVTYTNFEISN